MTEGERPDLAKTRMPPPWRLRSRRKMENPGRDNSESGISGESQDSTMQIKSGE